MKGAAALAAAAAGGTALSSCSSGGETSNEFSILQYEDPTQAQGQGWKLAVQIFKKKHPELTVKWLFRIEGVVVAGLCESLL